MLGFRLLITSISELTGFAKVNGLTRFRKKKKVKVLKKRGRATPAFSR